MFSTSSAIEYPSAFSTGRYSSRCTLSRKSLISFCREWNRYQSRVRDGGGGGGGHRLSHYFSHTKFLTPQKTHSSIKVSNMWSLSATVLSVLYRVCGCMCIACVLHTTLAVLTGSRLWKSGGTCFLIAFSSRRMYPLFSTPIACRSWGRRWAVVTQTLPKWVECFGGVHTLAPCTVYATLPLMPSRLKHSLQSSFPRWIQIVCNHVLQSWVWTPVMQIMDTKM